MCASVSDDTNGVGGASTPTPTVTPTDGMTVGMGSIVICVVVVFIVMGFDPFYPLRTQSTPFATEGVLAPVDIPDLENDGSVPKTG